MELTELIAALSQPAAYSMPVGRIEVRQTHISVVFLTETLVYKIKKPVSLGFLDFSTLEKRKHFCEEEVRLNRRLAPGVYQGVAPVVPTVQGLRFGAAGDAVEWAVQMARLPDAATLQKRLWRGELDAKLIEMVARRIAGFHAQAERSERIASFGRFDVVAGNARENFEQSAPLVGAAVSRAVYERLRELTEAELQRLRPLIEQRAERGVVCDTHGDLHLDHVYYFSDRSPPDDLVIIDCIEFNERFRFADPVADMAFLAMDLRFHARRDLAGRLADAYFAAANDPEGRDLLAFYTSYRAVVRGKVEGLKRAESEVPEVERTAALVKSRAYWLVALGELEQPGRRPCLLLVGGLPGSGKSTLARSLAETAGFTVIRSDVVRKELAGVSGPSPPRAGFAEGIYTREWTERTYAECLRRAEELLFEGKRVLIDASFQEEEKRRRFLDAAVRWGVPALFFICRADPETVRRRLAERKNDVSDADWQIHQHVAAHWQDAGEATKPFWREINTAGDQATVLARARALLLVDWDSR